MLFKSIRIVYGKKLGNETTKYTLNHHFDNFFLFLDFEPNLIETDAPVLSEHDFFKNFTLDSIHHCSSWENQRYDEEFVPCYLVVPISWLENQQKNSAWKVKCDEYLNDLDYLTIEANFFDIKTKIWTIFKG